MKIVVDPDDRNDFIERVQSIFEDENFVSKTELVEAVGGDAAALASVRQKVQNKKAKVASYLLQYDNAKNSQERMAVISSISRTS